MGLLSSLFPHNRQQDRVRLPHKIYVHAEMLRHNYVIFEPEMELPLQMHACFHSAFVYF